MRQDASARRECTVAGLVGVLCVVVSPAQAWAQAAPPAPHDDQAFDVMNLLAQRGLHPLDDERWNLYGQFTYISSFKLPFSAPYTNANGSNHSLVTDYERSFTASFTLFFGLRLWRGGEVYFVPELISERALSGLSGLGGSIQNFELQKTGSETPQIYRARLFYRQTFGLGGSASVSDSNPMQLGTRVESRRVVLTVGNFTVLDVFDHNGVTGDPRQIFLNMAFMTHASFDFAADARGYTWGAVGELYWDDWAFRVGQMQPPANPNSPQVDLHFWQLYSHTLEIEHDHTTHGLRGAVRLLVYHNHVFSGRFADAIADFQANPAHNAAACMGYNYSSANVSAPDVCWVRRPNDKWGIGINLEQYVSQDVGLFFRGMISDGQSEVDAFNPADASLSLGAVARGPLWHRAFDLAGLGVGLSFISSIHAQYLAEGGVDGFVGDGHLRPGPETVFDGFYSLNLLRAIWLTADYQLILNPGFNADRPGPVHIFGARVHAEF